MCIRDSTTSLLPAEEPQAGKQVEQELKVTDKAIPYLLYLPKEYGAGDRKWPIMLFLHGSGERNGPLNTVKKWGRLGGSIMVKTCLLYTSDAADERPSVDLGGR